MIKNKLFFLLIIALAGNIFSAKAQYKLEFKIKNFENKDVQLGYYYADKQFILDKQKTDEKGKVVFEGEENLARGLYIAILENQMYFDILISDDQVFSIETDTTELTKSMKVKGSTENENFYAFQQEIMTPVKKRAKYAERMYELPKGADSVSILQKQIDEINVFMESAWKKYAEKDKNSFLTNLLTAFNAEPEYNYSDKNFFEHINFADSGLVRSPVLNRACKLILARNLNKKLPTSNLKREVTRLLKKAEANPEVYSYVFTHFLNFFHSFQRDGINEMFVYFFDDYVKAGKTPWFNEKAVEQIKKQADIFRYSLVGSKAFDLSLESLSGEFVALKDLHFDKVFVFFWSTGCGHCESASEDLRKFYKENSDLDLEVYSVYTKGDRKAWESFQKEFGTLDWINVWDPKNETEYKQHYYISSTPILYVLDKDKTITDKFIGDGPIKNYLETLKL